MKNDQYRGARQTQKSLTVRLFLIPSLLIIGMCAHQVMLADAEERRYLALLVAVRSNDIQGVGRALKAGADPNLNCLRRKGLDTIILSFLFRRSFTRSVEDCALVVAAGNYGCPPPVIDLLLQDPRYISWQVIDAATLKFERRAIEDNKSPNFVVETKETPLSLERTYLRPIANRLYPIRAKYHPN